MLESKSAAGAPPDIQIPPSELLKPFTALGVLFHFALGPAPMLLAANPMTHP